jgi:hypothetical protein
MPTKLKKIAKPTAQVETPAPVKAATKRVARVTPPVEVKAEAKTAPKVAKEKVSKGTRNISRDVFLGRNMRISEYQDYTLSVNAKARLTDEELCAAWQVQFPNAVRFTPYHVKGVRRDYNAGLHSKAFAGRKVGDAISVAYLGKDAKAAATTPKVAKVAKATAA